MDFGTIRQRVEDLPAAGGRVIDTIADALRQILVRLDRQDAAIARLTARATPVFRQVGAPPPSKAKVTVVNNSGTEPAPSVVEPGEPRGPGRPKGSTDSYQRIRRSSSIRRGFLSDENVGGTLDPKRDLIG